MKKIFFKRLTICIFLWMTYTAGFASFDPSSDTIRRLLLASNVEVHDAVIVLKSANIVYPEILAGNEEESLDYIEKFSTARRDYLVRIYNQGKKIFPKVEAILGKYDVPTEYKVLLALESGFNGNAVSRAGAVGYWQFMDEVAKEYGLKIPAKTKSQGKKSKITGSKKAIASKKGSIDERKNFQKSTVAAARYLQDRSRNLDNDWLLIAASYNCGVGNVWNAMEKSGKKSPTFWDINRFLPAETRAYVMNFITLNVIFHNYKAFSENTLCFKDITCKASELRENAADISPSPIIE